ncbi:MAG: type II toxin-antitoxin system Phd/YefM family antitoxin [Propioniciclava sp.]|uniref:type II toxin-antitoxin system Phd/YefM family antitoxin n=1 Tax=Propioniciclava sp. TaxID=2038686 RepID=UPI0039E60D76
MRTVNVYEAKTHLSKLLEAVEAGEKVTIARAGKPIADLVPHQRIDLVWGAWKGLVIDLPDDFDAVDPELVSLFEGGALA